MEYICNTPENFGEAEKIRDVTKYQSSLTIPRKAGWCRKEKGVVLKRGSRTAPEKYPSGRGVGGLVC